MGYMIVKKYLHGCGYVPTLMKKVGYLVQRVAYLEAIV